MSGAPKLITGLETQLDFPIADLSERNAELLELMLANADLVFQGHTRAEAASWLYRAGHPAMNSAGGRILLETSQTEAFDHGIRSYETICAFVQAAPERTDFLAVNVNAAALKSALGDDALRSYIDDAANRLKHELPRTAEIVFGSSKRFFQNVAGYALYGAGLARQFELDSTN